MSKTRSYLLCGAAIALMPTVPLGVFGQLSDESHTSPVGNQEAAIAADNAAASPSVDHNACQFCHRPEEELLKARSYNMYASPSVGMRQDLQPNMRSLICLSCHDGSMNVGPIADPANERLNLGTDMRNDHPVSIVYEPFRDGGFKPAAPGPAGQMQVGGLPLFDGRVECTTCHEPHSGEANALKMSNARSALCLTCHNK